MILSLVIPVHDQASRLQLTLAGLERQAGITPEDFEVIIGDDDSSEDISVVTQSVSRRSPYRVEMIRCNSKGARGLARNLGAQRACGEVILFLDADALPGRNLLSRHLLAHSVSSRVCLGDIHVLAGTELLSDPATGLPLPKTRPENPLILPLDAVRQGIPDEELLSHAQKGGYPGHARWHHQLEEALEEGDVPFAWMGVIPHNLSIARKTFFSVGGFDVSLPHMEGWDFGIRVVCAGTHVVFARGALTFHLFHQRDSQQMTQNSEQALKTVSTRYPDEYLELLQLWLFAAMGDPYLPKELNLENWRVVKEMLADPEQRAECWRMRTAWRGFRDAISVIDYRLGAALNPTFR